MDGGRDRLSRELPIPKGWSELEMVDDCVDIAGVQVHRAGISSRNSSGIEVTGSAAARGGSPLRRAWLELLERMAIVDSGVSSSDDPRRRPSRSNGVAAHATWAAACESARLELIERDRILRSWYGELTPEMASVPDAVCDIRSHAWQACVVSGEPWGEVEVAAVVGFPHDPEIPLARGFAARASRRAAIEAAGREALQTLAFLWAEPVPVEPPELSPTPIYHLDYYLYPPHHAALRGWLAGEHMRCPQPLVPAPADIRFIDFTPPTLGGRLHVAQAASEVACSLEFGEPSAAVAARLPPELHVHPIS